MRKKGWTADMLASRWGMTRGGISNIAAEPSQRDKDAVNWLPDVRHDPPGLEASPGQGRREAHQGRGRQAGGIGRSRRGFEDVQ